MSNNDGRTLQRPLNAVDIQQLKDTLKTINEGIDAAKKAQSAGLDMTSQLKDLADAKEKASKLLAAYG